MWCMVINLTYLESKVKQSTQVTTELCPRRSSNRSPETDSDTGPW